MKNGTRKTKNRNHTPQHHSHPHRLATERLVDARQCTKVGTGQLGEVVGEAGDGDEIAGAAGSPGRATGRARVVLDAYADEPTEPGEVLVAPITDPGWMPLFVGAVGVVAEMGGELSHTMIVSRDLGIPAVVGAVGATTAIKTGDLIEVDGSSGTVRILERA